MTFRIHHSILLIILALQSLAHPQSEVNTYSTGYPVHPLQLTVLRDQDGSCTVVSFVRSQPHRLLTTTSDVVVVSQRFNIEFPKSQDNLSEKLDLFGHAYVNIWERAKTLCPDLLHAEIPAEPVNQHAFSFPLQPLGLEIYPLEVSGQSSNRVDLTFFSDGYTADEKDKFLADAKRLASDMSQNQTFASVRPMLNFWAAFIPSRESGIGVGGVPKDTAFGLYRDGTELRAVYCSKPEDARKACLDLGSRCNYPILLGNDPFYGGLGGEFTISTASKLNGALVLRHELGHSIIEVGEEYDGGFAYFGVNSVSEVSQETAISWDHWLSPESKQKGTPRKERAVMSFQAYPWTLLNKTSAWSASFQSSGLYARFLVRFSLSGLPKKEHLSVHLDGKDLEWSPRPAVGMDRWHYDINIAQPLVIGSHNLSFTLGDSAKEDIAQLCSAEIIEYGDENEFNSTVGYYGAFPTFSNVNETTFRPTNEHCLMRVVTSPNFCSVCLEGLWMSLLKRISIIDLFTVSLLNPRTVALDLSLVPLGQFRNTSNHRPAGEIYTITWTRDGVQVPGFANMTKITVAGDVQGVWRADIQLHTEEVRADPNGLLKQWAIAKLSTGRRPEMTIG